MRQPWFCYLLVIFIFISFPVNQVLHPSFSFPMLPDFFHFIFFFFINNCWRRCWFLMLSFELWLHTSCQQVLIEDIMNHPSFWKLQFKCSWSNVLRDSEWSVSFIVQLLWGSVQMDIFVFQPHIVTNLQSLRISPFLVKLLLYILLSFFYCIRCLFPAFL